MPDSSKARILVVGLSLYALLSLISMATMSIGTGILLGCLLYYHGGLRAFLRALFGRDSELRKNRAARIFAGISIFFALACVLSLVVARFWPPTVGGRISESHPLKDSAKLWYFVWPFVLWHALQLCGEMQRRVALKIWLGTFLALSVLALFQHFTGWPRPLQIPTDLTHFHATLFLGHHLSVASILIFPFFAWLDIPGVPLLPRVIGAIAGFIGLMFTYSRTLWVALPAGVALWAFLKLGKRGKIASLIALLLALAAAYQVPTVRNRFTDLGGIYHREDLWEANWRFFEERPLTGVGLKHNEELSGYYLMEKFHSADVFQGHAHNNILDILSSTGLVGAVGFFAWWAFLVGMLTLEIRKGVIEKAEFFGKGLLAAFLVYQLNGLTQVNFWEAKVQHQLMWMVAWVLLWRGQCQTEHPEL